MSYWVKGRTECGHDVVLNLDNCIAMEIVDDYLERQKCLND